MVPHALVFSNEVVLLWGETQKQRSMLNFMKSDFVVREYELRGIENFIMGDPSERKLAIDPAKIYAHSYKIWSGDMIHDIVIEDVMAVGSRKKISKKVCGAEEIISAVTASSQNGIGNSRRTASSADKFSFLRTT